VYNGSHSNIRLSPLLTPSDAVWTLTILHSSSILYQCCHLATSRSNWGLSLEMGTEPNPNRTNRTRTLIFEERNRTRTHQTKLWRTRTEPNPWTGKTRTELELCGVGSFRFLVSLLTITKNSYLLNVNSFYTPVECITILLFFISCPLSSTITNYNFLVV